MKTRKPIDYASEDTRIGRCNTLSEVEAHCHRSIRAIKLVHQKELAPYLDMLVKIESLKTSQSLLFQTSDAL